jgi:serine protease Do
MAIAATAVAGAATLGSVLTAQTVHFSKGDGPPQIVDIFRVGGRLGVSVRDITDEDLKNAKGATQGVIVDDVETDSPAQKAGVKDGDVIVEFDGERVRTTRQFTRLVQESPVGRSVPIIVLRDGQRVPLNVSRKKEDSSSWYFDKFVDIPKPAKIVPPPMSPKFELFSYGGRLGISIQELSPQLAEYFGTKDGVLVTSVSDNSNASKAGLKAGDVITSFDGQAITSTSELVRRTQRLDGGDEFSIGVVRDKKSITLKGKLEMPQPKRATGARTII